MKEALLISIVLFISCGQPQQNKSAESKKVDYIFEATYLDDFKIGNPELVLKVQEMHQYIISKDY